MKKRFLSAILSICMVTIFLPTMTYASVENELAQKFIDSSENRTVDESLQILKEFAEAGVKGNDILRVGNVENLSITDNSPPTLINFSVDKTTVEAPGEITFTAEVSDDSSGVRAVGIFFTSDSNLNHSTGFTLNETEQAGIYKGTLDIGMYEPTRTQKVRKIYLYDVAGNERTIDFNDEYTFTVVPDTTPPTLTAGTVNRTSNTSATITFTTNEKGTAYYKVVDQGAAAPEITDVSTVHGFNSLGSVNAGTVPAKYISLTTGAKDIYVYVVDASGNYNAGLKIAVAAYSSGSGGSTGGDGGGGGGGGSAAPSTPVVKTPEVAPQPEAPVAPTDNTENSQPKTTTVIKPGSKIATITNDDDTSRQTTMDVVPMIQDGRTMMPARFVADVLGVGVNYDNQTKTATFKYDEATVTLTLGQKTMTVNGQTVALQTAPMLVDGRILLPLRDIQEAFKGLGLNATIDWNAETKEVTIEK